MLLSGCWKPEPATLSGEPRYVVGEAYQLRNLWFYPREDFALVETGLATLAADSRPGRRIANGEVHDPSAATAAHRTLQLPAVVRVTNLENGRSVLLRVNDRGPADPGRVLELSRRAGELLGVGAGRPAQVRVAVEGDASRALAAGLPLPESSRPRIEAAPSGSVERETLAPLAGSRQAERVREGRPTAVAVAGGEASRPAPAVPLPEQVVQGPSTPGRLFVQGSSFSTPAAAQRQASRLGGARVEPAGPARRPEWRVRLGPFANVAEADRALDEALRGGVSEARIVVD
ncbi:SPOR domain-containing protein [Roseomonas nepalensis]|uniref:Endolytic peptidoglycan transglycosylase RlpA n=2 Tax=Muricoccus nepalensis TaxID=1854500 RepID=A0A502FUN0_9PROT|nr:SPOR domain-containing protein [Roseomonas nepalensis]